MNIAERPLPEQKFHFAVHRLSKQIALSFLLFAGLAFISLFFLLSRHEHNKHDVELLVLLSVFFTGLALLTIFALCKAHWHYKHNEAVLTVNSNGVTARYGFLSRHLMTIPWCQIRDISIRRVKQQEDYGVFFGENISITFNRTFLRQIYPEKRAWHKNNIQIPTIQIADNHQEVLATLRTYWHRANGIEPAPDELPKCFSPSVSLHKKLFDMQFEFDAGKAFWRILPFFCLFATLAVVIAVKLAEQYRYGLTEKLFQGIVLFILFFLSALCCLWLWIRAYRLRKQPILGLSDDGLAIYYGFWKRYDFALAWTDIASITIYTNRYQYLCIAPSDDALDQMPYPDRCRGVIRIPTWQIKGNNKTVLNTLRNYWQAKDAETAAVVDYLEAEEAREKIRDWWIWGISVVIAFLIFWMKYA